MSEHSEAFVRYLQDLSERDRGALAILRHSLAFEPGAYPKAYPYVERFVNANSHEQDGRRLALYLVAGLFARHSSHDKTPVAAALGELMRRRESPSIEMRFIALLGADPETVAEYLRQVVSLLAADGIGCDYARLLDDLSVWMNTAVDPAQRDRLRQRWARDFYRAVQKHTNPDNVAAE